MSPVKLRIIENSSWENRMQELEKHNAPDLVQEISLLIEESKQQVLRTANSALTMLFWNNYRRR